MLKERVQFLRNGGKRDENLILPLNDSISTTLSVDQMHAKTTIMASPHFKEDKMWLNSKKKTTREAKKEMGGVENRKCASERIRMIEEDGHSLETAADEG
uniref:Diphosphomevalonate decarboxylase-like N-terminal domain-containing protein n=1 Tax=Timema monikensis TaxID=170555 RepID=A0A7R9E8C2_9NEOP|nr:unnamed protein product [Timema monikensis]